MYKKHYVIQIRWHDWEKWENLPYQYTTLDEAKRALKQRYPGPKYRIAESYTVIRYKAVKT